jgi:hypothetical protein
MEGIRARAREEAGDNEERCREMRREITAMKRRRRGEGRRKQGGIERDQVWRAKDGNDGDDNDGGDGWRVEQFLQDALRRGSFSLAAVAPAARLQFCAMQSGW